MLVRTLGEVVASPREVVAENWTSRRLLLKADGMGFSMHDTLIRKNTRTSMWYRHHLEAVYCIEGRGRITTEDGRCFDIEPGTLYALDAHDKHVLEAETELRLICVFNPPLVGSETHGPDGAYPAAAE
jgi:L-ectoine synthase